MAMGGASLAVYQHPANTLIRACIYEVEYEIMLAVLNLSSGFYLIVSLVEIVEMEFEPVAPQCTKRIRQRLRQQKPARPRLLFYNWPRP